MTATGVGGWPGTSARAAATAVSQTCDGLPHLPELPARGPGGDMIGRAMARIAKVAGDLAVHTALGGWRLSGSPGRDLSRADGYWSEDLDAIEERFEGHVGPFKVQLAGPLTLAASVEDRAGEKLLRDAGAVRDLAGASAQAWLDLIAEVRRRLPGADVIMQVDEPLLADVLSGKVPTQSTWTTYPAVARTDATGLLQTVRAAHGGEAVLHCCAEEVPFDVLADAGFAASFDMALVGAAAVEAVGHHIDAGRRVFLGVEAASVTAGVAAVTRFGRAVGYAGHEWAGHVVMTPPCDLLDMPMAQACATMERLAAVAAALTQEG